jgi:hypothetical protein
MKNRLPLSSLLLFAFSLVAQESPNIYQAKDKQVYESLKFLCHIN